MCAGRDQGFFLGGVDILPRSLIDAGLPAGFAAGLPAGFATGFASGAGFASGTGFASGAGFASGTGFAACSALAGEVNLDPICARLFELHVLEEVYGHKGSFQFFEIEGLLSCLDEHRLFIGMHDLHSLCKIPLPVAPAVGDKKTGLGKSERKFRKR